jgi:HlyD family secretion protein
LRNLFLLALLAAAGAAAYFYWQSLQPPKLPEGFASSNGRLEATEIDVATKLAGRIAQIGVNEGDFVTAGQVVAQMDIDSLKAQLHEAEAELRRAQTAVEASRSTVLQRESEKAAAQSIVAQRMAQFDTAKARYNRSVAAGPAVSKETLDDDRAGFYTAEANVNAAKANVAGADAAIATAKAEVIRADAAVDAAKAKIQRLQADINDCTLKAPRAGRVQYRVAQPGEVLPGGGKVLNMIDLGDVYMTFFLPTNWAGRVKVGSEVRIVLDVAPQFVIPAKVTFVADVAQFTPKTVETVEERQKLTFRIKAHLDPEELKKHIRDVKTGLPGMAYVQLDPQAKWPAHLEVRLPQ